MIKGVRTTGSQLQGRNKRKGQRTIFVQFLGIGANWRLLGVGICFLEGCKMDFVVERRVGDSQVDLGVEFNRRHVLTQRDRSCGAIVGSRLESSVRNDKKESVGRRWRIGGRTSRIEGFLSSWRNPGLGYRAEEAKGLLKVRVAQ